MSVELGRIFLHRRVIGAAARRQRKSRSHCHMGSVGTALYAADRVAYLWYYFYYRAARRSPAATKSRGRSSREPE